MTSQKILFVDDEMNLLESLQRGLRNQFTIEIASSGSAGLNVLEAQGPFAVIVADMNMPLMNGIEFFKRVQDKFPHTIRIMLTGNSDLQTAIEAVNDGRVFRFLTKPCSMQVLGSVIKEGFERYTKENAERSLMSNTLNGKVGLLADALAIVQNTFKDSPHTEQACRAICKRWF